MVTLEIDFCTDDFFHAEELQASFSDTFMATVKNLVPKVSEVNGLTKYDVSPTINFIVRDGHVQVRWDDDIEPSDVEVVVTAAGFYLKVSTGELHEYVETELFKLI